MFLKETMVTKTSLHKSKLYKSYLFLIKNRDSVTKRDINPGKGSHNIIANLKVIVTRKGRAGMSRRSTGLWASARVIDWSFRSNVAVNVRRGIDLYSSRSSAARMLSSIRKPADILLFPSSTLHWSFLIICYLTKNI